MKELDQMLVSLLWSELQATEAFKDNIVTLEKIKSNLNNKIYDKWIEESLSVLVKHDYLKFDGQNYFVKNKNELNSETLWKEWEAKKVSWIKNPDMKVRLRLIETTLKSLSDILLNKKRATDIMFPNSSMDLVQGIYKDNKISDYFNGVVGDMVVAFVKEIIRSKKNKGIKILEIGAGTGGTSDVVIKKLKTFTKYVDNYCYTDISRGFLLYAEDVYAKDYPYVTYKTFNVEESLEKQEIKANEFDIVIATNVLHATKNISRTLGNAKATMKKNGILVLNEINSKTLFNHLTFGLLEGWWLYEDQQLRISGCPALREEAWKDVLQKEGFRSVFFPAKESHYLGQQIIIAESDGIVVQKVQSSAIIDNQSKASHSMSNKIPEKIINNINAKTKEEKVVFDSNVTTGMHSHKLRVAIREYISSVLKIKEEKIQNERSFWEYGIDSIIGVRLVNLINEKLGIEMQTTVLFDYNNVNKLNEHILNTYNENIIPKLNLDIDSTENNCFISQNKTSIDKINGQQISNQELACQEITSSKDNYNDSILSLNPIKNRFSVMNNNNLNERTLKQTVQKVQNTYNPTQERDSIAIIGISGKFAKSENVDELWENLENGTDLIENVSRWDFMKKLPYDKNYCNQGSFLDNIDKFDPVFFNISGREATYMDPQQRIFLEESWKALEDAGYAGKAIEGRKCGVFVGCVRGDYHKIFDANPPAQAFWGNSASVIPARISYYLDLQGPALAIDTACSSSLVAIHLACQSIWSNESQMAVAGGVFINTTDEFYLSCNRASMLSPTGRCHTFDKDADGFVPGEGVGIVILKSLNEAIKDQDQIYGVISGTAINQDGSTNGITAPSAISQERLEKNVYDTFNINPANIQMVEAHGTGTKLGDPIEYQALTNAFRHYTKKSGYCAIGSIKTNLGHTSTAAGVAGVLKVLLSMRYKKIPPSLHYKEGNPSIKFDNSPFYVNTQLREWKINENEKRCAAISCFGFSGTNVHMVIEEAPFLERQYIEKPSYLIVLSARNMEQLKQQAQQLIKYCKNNQNVDCGNMSYTLLTGRKHFNNRLACVVKNKDEIIDLLNKWLDKENCSNVYSSEINENKHIEKLVLKRFGNQCIESCRNVSNTIEYQENISMVAELYVQGYSLQFEDLFSDGGYSKISLPTYPFSRQSYWVNPKLDKELVANKVYIEPTTSSEKNYANKIEDNRDVLLNTLERKNSVEKNGVKGITLNNTETDIPDIIMTEQLAHQNNSNKVKTLKILKKEIIQSLATALFIDENDIEEDRQFIDMGMDSIIGVEWVQGINKKYKTSILATKIYDYPTVKEFANFLEKNLPNKNKHVEKKLVEKNKSNIIEKQGPWIQLQEISNEQTNKKSVPESIKNSVTKEKINTNISVDSLNKQLTLSLTEALFIDENEIEEDKQFIDMGMDSIIGVEWIQGINKKYGTSILATKIYDYPTIREFGSYFKKQLSSIYAESNIKDEKVVQAKSKNNIESNKLQINLSELPHEKKEIKEEKKSSNLINNSSMLTTINPEVFGNPSFQKRYRCKWNYYCGAMYRGISSEALVSAMSNNNLLSFFGSAGFNPEQLEKYINNLQKQVNKSSSYGIGLLCDLNDSGLEKSLVELIIKYNIPFIEVGAYSLITEALVLCRLKGIQEQRDKIVFPRRIIGKCSRLEIAKLFLAPPPIDIVESLLSSHKISEEEARISRKISLVDDIAVEGDSGGHTDQEVLMSLLPMVISLRNKMISEYNYREEIMIGCGGGIGTPEAVVSAFALGAEFIFTGSINQCTIESGASGVVKELLSNVDIHDTAITMAGDMFEIGSKIQVVKKNTQFAQRANRLYKLFMQYNSIDDMPKSVRKELETKYFKHSIEDIWEKVCCYKNKINPKQLEEANENQRLKTAMIFKWYFAHCNKITLDGDMSEKDNFIIHCGPAMGAFNQWVNGTKYECWKNRHVYEIAELLMNKACEHIDNISFLSSRKINNKNIEIKEKDKHTQCITVDENFNKQNKQSSDKNTEECSKTIDNNAIAIIGMSGQFPKSKTLDEFWNNIANGKDCISEIPKERWSSSEYFDEDIKVPLKTYSKWMGVLEDIDKFDPLFFNISPVEAEIMDPQQRLFLKNCWNCIEDAGINPDSLSGSSCGVFAGCGAGDYGNLIQEKGMNAQGLIGGQSSVLSARISYLLNLKGPSLAIDTACSSSLVAIAEACNNLVLKNCDMAIAGGVYVMPGPSMHIMTSKAEMLSKDGRCYTFDSRANGFVPGEGVGTILLKRLNDAERDNNRIYGVIRGWGLNQDGKTNGITAPSVNSQIELEKYVYDRFKINPETISMVEAHGTGTKLGDPIEVEALTEAFNSYTSRKNYCALGSVKSNIGHLLTAAGVSGVMKVLLALKNSMLPPTINFDKLNEHISLDNSPFYINTKLTKWKTEIGIPRRASVSSFGFSGTNAHIVIEEYNSNAKTKEEKANNTNYPNIFVLSAKSQEQLKKYAQSLKTWIESNKEIKLSEILYTLQIGRKEMDNRLAFVVNTKEELIKYLKKYMYNDTAQNIFTANIRKTKGEISIFEDNNHVDILLNTWLSEKKLENIARFWAKGLRIDWNKLYGNSKPQPISLPTYPFTEESYWIANVEGTIKNKIIESNIIKSLDMPDKNKQEIDEQIIQREKVFLEKTWSNSHYPSRLKIDGSVCILTTDETLELAEKLSESFFSSYILNVNDINEQLIQKEQNWDKYIGCIDLIGCGQSKNYDYNWINWIQNIIEYGNKQNLTLLCVTRALESFKNTNINIVGATSVGLYRMLQSEYSSLTSRHLDLEMSIAMEVICKQIVTEFYMDSSEYEACYREGTRYTAYLKEVKLNEKKQNKISFNEDEVLWITGGTRGIGYLCASHFVRNYGVKRLVLSGREQLPPEHEWDRYVNEKTSIASKIKNIKKLQVQGVQVKVISIPMTDKRQMEKSIKDIKNTMGSIAGLIHSAGMYDSENPAFIRKPIDSIQKVLEPKVEGLDILIESLKKEPIKLFLLFSSISAIVPTLAVGHGDYAMANAYMDYCAKANSLNYPITSIQWNSWKEIGMGEAKTKAYKNAGLLSHTNEEGLQMLDTIINNSPNTVILPAVVDNKAWDVDRLTKPKQEECRKESHSKNTDYSYTLQKGDELLEGVQKWIISVFSKELKLASSKIETDVPFEDYGVDSILISQIVRSINKILNEDLDVSILYEYNTIQSFADWIINNYKEVIKKILKVSIYDEKVRGKNNFIDNKESKDKDNNNTKKVSEEYSNAGHNSIDIAVVGMSCCFAGAKDLDEYWNILSEGKNTITSVPSERFGYSNNYYAGLIDNKAQFNADHFLLPKEDVEAMDLQALLVLEESQRLWNHAGYNQNNIRGKSIGVYIGGRSRHIPHKSALERSRNPIVAVGQNYLAANISHFFDLHGPSVVIDTACSSALVAMNMAINAIRLGDVESAVVGGVSLLNTDDVHRMFSQRGILSKESTMHVFDQRANGIVLGEGVGMVLLKNVQQAIEDGDKIYSIVKSVAINNDGRTAGPATPNINAQKQVMAKALKNSGKNANDIKYIEANGSGSEVTDLLELKAIHGVYPPDIIRGLGSVKPNIGHTLCAEGIAGFIKVVLMIHNKKLIPFLSGQVAMKHYKQGLTTFDFYRKSMDWMDNNRVAAINCFADGGTNAHVILESWEESYSKQTNQTVKQPPVTKSCNAKSYKEDDILSLSTNHDISISDEKQINCKQENPRVSTFWKRKSLEV